MYSNTTEDKPLTCILLSYFQTQQTVLVIARREIFIVLLSNRHLTTCILWEVIIHGSNYKIFVSFSTHKASSILIVRIIVVVKKNVG